MRRRDFVKALALSAAVWPLATRAQQPAMPVVGFFNPSSAVPNGNLLDSFRRGLAEAGYVEGRNVMSEYRWANGQYDLLPALVADLIARRVNVIAACGSSAPGLAAKAATTTIPIVFQTGGDPVEDGLVTNMNRPGGNVTGVSRMTVALDPKRLEILHDAVPSATRFAFLVNRASFRANFVIQQIQKAAQSRGFDIVVAEVDAESDLDGAFAAMKGQGADALLLGNDPVMLTWQDKIVALALHYGLPTISNNRIYATAGALMSYDSSLGDSYRQVGFYVGRILKGEKPADLPIQQPTKFELVINQKTAKALGVKFPQTLLATADEVIE